MWGKDFLATYTVTITDDFLDTVFNVKNLGGEDFVHQAALHTYFDISSVGNLSIEGSFKGKEYLDKVRAGGANRRLLISGFLRTRFALPTTNLPRSLLQMTGETKTEERDAITISQETDSVYFGVKDPSVVDAGKGKKISVVDAMGWTDCVVWNPFGNEGMGYNSFVCAESVAFNPVTVLAGGEWEGSMKLKVSDI